ncbi:hypothetical protein [Thermococcus sp.]
MPDEKKALIGIVISLLPLVAILLGEPSERYGDVAFLTSFFIYVLLLPWATGEHDEKTLLTLIGAMALMAPALGTLTQQPGILVLNGSSGELRFSTEVFLLLSASGILYYYGLSAISRKTGTGAFKIQGFLYLLASVGSVTLIGIIGWIGWLLGVPVSHVMHYRAVRGE